MHLLWTPQKSIFSWGILVPFISVVGKNKISVEILSSLGQCHGLETGLWQPDKQWLLLAFCLMSTVFAPQDNQ